MHSKASTVAEYIASLPEDRKVAIEAVRKVVLKNLGKGYSEGMTYGMIGYFVPHSVYPAGYHCDSKQPLPFAGLASQKNYMSLYMMSVYCGCDGGEQTELLKWFQQAWAKTGKKLDMGKACIRFKKLEDLALEVIGEAVRRVPVELYIKRYEAVLASSAGAVKKKAGAGGKSGSETAPKRAAKKSSTVRVVKAINKPAAKSLVASKKPPASGKGVKRG